MDSELSRFWAHVLNARVVRQSESYDALQAWVTNTRNPQVDEVPARLRPVVDSALRVLTYDDLFGSVVQ